jgi:hypothetical protein
MDVSGAYQRRIGGVSVMYRGRIGVVRILRYVSWSIGCVSHANRNRICIGYVSDTGYMGNEMNLGNPVSKGKEKYSPFYLLFCIF